MSIRLTKERIILNVILFFATPFVVYAQPASFSELVDDLIGIIGALVPVVISLTVLFVLWAGAMTIMNADNPEERSKGKKKLVWGIVTLFIMVSVWGLVNILRSVLLFT